MRLIIIEYIIVILALKRMNLYQVQSILGKRYNISKKKVEYKVKWVGYPQSQATWEPKNNLKFVNDMIMEYEDKHNIKKARHEEPQQPSGASQPIEDSSALVGQSAFEDKTIKKQQEEQSEQQPFQPKTRRLKISKHKMVTKQSRRRQSRRRRRRSSRRDSAHDDSLGAKGNSKRMATRNHKKLQGGSYSSARSEGYCHNNSSQSFPSNSHQDVVDSLPEIIDLPSDSEAREDSAFTILELARKNDNLLFLVSQQEQKRWVSRAEVIREHPLALIAFYEKNIKFRPKEESALRNL